MNDQQNHVQFHDEQIAPQAELQSVHQANPIVTDQHLRPELQRPEIDDSLYKQARSSFIFKVYIILAMELLFNAVIVCVTMTNAPIMQFMVNNTLLSMFAFLAGTACYIALVCKPTLCQAYPKNMMMLAVFTLCTSYWVSAICAIYEVQSVVLAAGATAASAIGITLYIKFSESDFSAPKQFISALGSSLVSAALFVSLASFFFPIPAYMGIITVLMSLLYPIYLAYDTKMILDGTKHHLSLDQYVLASLLLYIDIVSIFLDILRLVGNRR